MNKDSIRFPSIVNTISKNCVTKQSNNDKLLISFKNITKKQQVFVLPLKNSMPPNLNFNPRKTHEKTNNGLWAKNAFFSKIAWHFWKFKYNGKGLKIKKNKKLQQILFNLGASHVSKIWYSTKTITILRTKKNTFTVLSASILRKKLNPLFRSIRLYNKYTKRGLRLVRQPVIRRFGKVSQLAPKKR